MQGQVPDGGSSAAAADGQVGRAGAALYEADAFSQNGARMYMLRHVKNRHCWCRQMQCVQPSAIGRELTFITRWAGVVSMLSRAGAVPHQMQRPIRCAPICAGRAQPEENQLNHNMIALKLRSAAQPHSSCYGKVHDGG